MSYININSSTMKKPIIIFFTALLLAVSVNAVADKLPKIAYVNIPKGRGIEMQALINNIGNAKGTVAINFVMDNKGKVLSAQIDPKNTTVKDKAFVGKVVQAVLAMKFNKDKHAPEKDMGSVAYIFN
jgi:hypothetical protein